MENKEIDKKAKGNIPHTTEATKPRLSIIGLLGIALFFYFSFDITLHTYNFEGKVIRLGLALLGLIVPLVVKVVCEREE